MRKKPSGFTLIEIMVVLAILGIMVSIAVPQFAGRTQEARIQAARIQIENLGMALDTLQLDCGRYPTNEEGLEALRQSPPGFRGWKGPYLRKPIPSDPWKNAYVYLAPRRSTDDFQLISWGPDRQEGGDDDIQN